jgi:NADPH2:quinone reductase
MPARRLTRGGDRIKAWVLHRTGDPREVLHVEDVAAAEPTTQELLVATEAAGIMFPDLLLVRGEYQITLPLPSTPGGELVGRVIRQGPGASIPVGTRVMATTSPGNGSFAEQVCVKEAHAQALPDDVPVPEATALPTNYVTAHLALHRRGGLQPGETVVVFGGAGGVGTAAIDLAQAAGARTIGVDTGADRVKICADAGADVTVDASTEDLGRMVQEFTDGRGADLVIDPVGGDLFEAARRFIAFEGRIVVVGFVSGSIPQIKVNQLLLRSFTVMGVNAMVTLFDHPEIHQESRRAVVELLAQGRIRPKIAGIHPFDALPEVLAGLGERRIAGKAVIDVTGDLVAKTA